MAVKVYTTATCPYCIQVKDFLKEKGVDYDEIDVGDDEKAAQEMIDKSGQMGVPVTDVDGEIIIGFDTDKLTKALGLKE